MHVTVPTNPVGSVNPAWNFIAEAPSRKFRAKGLKLEVKDSALRLRKYQPEQKKDGRKDRR